MEFIVYDDPAMGKRGKRGRGAGRLRLLAALTVAYLCIVVGYYFLPWSMRSNVYAVSPGLDRTLRRQGFRVVESWDGLGWWGHDCKIPIPQACGGKHLYGEHPSQSLNLPNRVTLLENEGYVVGYSDPMKNPLWVAYRVFDVPLLESGKRPSDFRVDRRTHAQVAPSDFRGSGYDRGHMAPNYAIATRYGKAAQWETFLMSNIIPQTPSINRYIWKDLEQRIARRYGRYLKEVWVITGPVFTEPVRRLASGVPIPSAYYKIVIDEDGNKLRVMGFLISSRAPPYTRLKSTLVSIDQIEELTGLDFFPAFTAEMQVDLESRAAGRLWPWITPALRHRLK